MAKTLSFTDTSAQTVKIGDTTTSFTMILGNDNIATDLTNATSITAKLGNSSGYLKSATIDPASLTEPTTGQVTVTFNADLMTSLTAGSYAIEVWVIDSTGTSIYPSDGSTGFAITNNIQSANGSTITTITFDDFVNKFNTITANALPGTTDTTNFQKLKITKDNGNFTQTVLNTDDASQKILSAPSGMSTWYIQSGATNNPAGDSMRGIVFKDSTNIGFGYFNPNSGDTSTSLYIAHIQNGTVTWTKATTTAV